MMGIVDSVNRQCSGCVGTIDIINSIIQPYPKGHLMWFWKMKKEHGKHQPQHCGLWGMWAGYGKSFLKFFWWFPDQFGMECITSLPGTETILLLALKEFKITLNKDLIVSGITTFYGINQSALNLIFGHIQAYFSRRHTPNTLSSAVSFTKAH